MQPIDSGSLEGIPEALVGQEQHACARNLLAGGLTTLFGAPIAFLIGGIPCFVAALVGWISAQTGGEKPRSVGDKHEH